MKIKILERTDREMEFELEGEGHTLCNLLRKVLLEDEDVTFAGYRIEHPLIGKPKVYVRTNGEKDPLEAVIEAAKKIKKMAEEFREAFLNSLKGSHYE
ncbi:MAG: DNA-directed RNA polymerase subunit L [Candidatus Baldrarchaeia archaeon]|nr:DNA-directed RNA polymerase subunit L [Candidatus Baldrarchaeota archaeon]